MPKSYQSFMLVWRGHICPPRRVCFFETESFIGYELTDMSNISSESSSSMTLMGTRRPGGIAGGLCPGSRVLIPRVSGAPNLCPANDVWPCSTMVFLAQPAHNTHTNHTLTNTMCVWLGFVCAKCPTRIIIITQCTYENEEVVYLHWWFLTCQLCEA